MGIFANEPDPDAPKWLGPRPGVQPFNGESGYDALGRPVPFYRQQAGYETCKAMGMKDREAIMTLIGAMADRIERDEPHAAMELAAKSLDVTGVYRLFAVLLTAEEPAAEGAAA